jgi:ATP-dependent DNA helicase RecG
MDQVALQILLDSLIAAWESEVVEFKDANDNFDTDKIGRYFSALSNQANLQGVEKAWLVFGVHDKTRQIIGTDYRVEPERLQSTKMQVANETDPRGTTFSRIHELITPQGRVVIFEINPAPRGMPIGWKGAYYSRAGESLMPLPFDKQDEIRQQTLSSDWSAQIVPNATISDLDETAVQKARSSFARKHANRFSVEEMAGWPIQTFLDRAKLTQNGQITRTALLLLGKAESSHLISPHPAQLTWKLEGEESAYEHFSTPFLLTTTQLYQKIRNIQIRLLPSGQLVPHEVSKYDQGIVLEALHNCIAHQDYERNGRINVIEKPDKLIFENEGSFYEGQPDDYVLGEKTPRRYRNSFLVQAMVELGMIDRMGYGIHRMHKGQAKRYFPLPDYDLTEENAVRITIYGGEVDPAYSQMLMQKTDLPFMDVLALDRVQKNLPIPDDAIFRLRRSKMIEGRKPNFHVSAVVAAATDHKAEYIRTRAQDDAHYAKLITDYLQKFGKASRQEIDSLLQKNLSEALDDYQKSRKIGNLLSNLRRSGHIRNAGVRGKPVWQLAERMQAKKPDLQNENEN